MCFPLIEKQNFLLVLHVAVAEGQSGIVRALLDTQMVCRLQKQQLLKGLLWYSALSNKIGVLLLKSRLLCLFTN